MVSKIKVAKGEALFSEKPFVSAQFAWNKFYQYKACEFCMKPIETAQENIDRLTERKFRLTLPFSSQCCPTTLAGNNNNNNNETTKNQHCQCKRCKVDYCSVECKDQAFNMYHRTLCANERLGLLMDFWRQIHLPPETNTIELVVKLIAIVKQVHVSFCSIHFSYIRIEKIKPI